MEKVAIIIGGGPAGLTAAYELLSKTDIKPIILEKTGDIGGLSKTVEYKGNRIDIGGHRFFSKSDTVMNWWLNIFPVEESDKSNFEVDGFAFSTAENKKFKFSDKEAVFLIRSRLSRVFYKRKFFDYPISFNFNTVKNLGIIEILKILLSYIKVKIFPIKPELTLRDFFINRFGEKLYLTFFKDYTKKVWGESCEKIQADWGAQRVKGLSITKVVSHFFKKRLKSNHLISQKKTETSLIERFLYPKLGPGQLWEKVAEKITDKGGKIYLHHEVIGIKSEKKEVNELIVIDSLSGKEIVFTGNIFFSSMPVKKLISSWNTSVPKEVQKIANGLKYRDFITVGLLLKKLKIKNNSEIKTLNNLIPDNWIYIQENEVKLGRLQVFNNWSPYLVKDQETVWLGLEYFCNEGDALWRKNDLEFINFAIDELTKIDFIEQKDVLDSVIIRTPDAYPAYFGTYSKFNLIRTFTDKYHNLFLIGRNGMHRYNNTDHSMLTAITAVDNIVNNIESKDNIWEINTEKEYHERKD